MAYLDTLTQQGKCPITNKEYTLLGSEMKEEEI